MAVSPLTLEQQITQLETELRLYKHLKLSSIERRINQLLDELDDPATPQTKGQRLKERIGIVAATVALTAIAQHGRPDIPLIFQQPVKQEQVSPKFSSGSAPSLAKGDSTTSKPGAKPEAKPGAKPEAKPSIRRLMQALATQESGGNHELINSDSGASGKWQVMPENIPSWSRAALGREVSRDEFLANPQVQEKVVQHRLNFYLSKLSSFPEQEQVQRAAAWWYSGNPDLWNDTKPQYTNGQRYPSIAEYTAAVWQHYISAKPFAQTKAIIATWPDQFQRDPVAGDVIAGYAVTSARGMRTLNGVTRMHQGVDLGTPIGTPVIAIADGQIECDYWPDAGKVAMFSSDEFPGLRFDLLHLDSCAAKPGTKLRVKQGEAIGTTGSWGTGPHLHLAIKSQESGNFLRVRAGWLHWFITGKKP